MTREYIPIYKYCEETKIPKQTVYRWIREGKLKEGEYKIIEKTVTRILIDKEYAK